MTESRLVGDYISVELSTLESDTFVTVYYDDDYVDEVSLSKELDVQQQELDELCTALAAATDYDSAWDIIDAWSCSKVEHEFPK